MNLPEDTIAAVSTPPGEGGIGIVRLSGGDSFLIAKKIFRPSSSGFNPDETRRTICHGFIEDPSTAETIDEVLITFMKSPHSYTREDVAEINCHGGMIPLRRILGLALREGARLAEPGEYTRRAFLNGRIDLSQAEAVIDIIRAKTEQAEKMALMQLEGGLSIEITDVREAITGICALVEAHIDFPEEDLEIPEKDRMLSSIMEAETRVRILLKSFEEGRIYREGAAMAIVGKPNVGKSSLLNALIKKDRAIITDLPGTTRDVIEEGLNINGLPVRIMDTAGIREAHDLVEAEGVKRSLGALAGADLALVVFDAGKPLDQSDRLIMEKALDKRSIFVINKCDIISPEFDCGDTELKCSPCVKISAKKCEGLEDLKEKIFETLVSNAGAATQERPADILVTNVRHKRLLDRALEALEQACSAIGKGDQPEVAALFLRESLDSLGEIVGAVTTDDILDRIFSEFCIGK
jgi:tRNA modification GTPase